MLARIQLLCSPKTTAARSRRFREDEHDRFSSHKLHATGHEPPIYATLDDGDWRVTPDWYHETARIGVIREIDVPATKAASASRPTNGFPSSSR
jgi:hypothetical protein